MFSYAKPTLVKQPRLLYWNDSLASELGIDRTPWSDEMIAGLLSGNTITDDIKPFAQAYAGHQFGNFTMLGDGRAILLGEHRTPSGQLFDIQLKGAGRTVFSRNGDGRATQSAMLREYLISEAMHALGIPTTRSLAVTLTGENVYRELVHDGAILTRVASSHLRVGTFEYASRYQPAEVMPALVQYTLARHYPELSSSDNTAFSLLEAVMERQLNLVIHWMRVGFIHGVMNTDNMSISGETIDYGPCAFMNTYNPETVFSSIDRDGRYAYGNQPFITQWNLAVLAGALLTSIDSVVNDKKKTVLMVQDLINTFPDEYKKRLYRMYALKLGIDTNNLNAKTEQLIDDILAWMKQAEADYTNTFTALRIYLQEHTSTKQSLPSLLLSNELNNDSNQYKSAEFLMLCKRLRELHLECGVDTAIALERMQSANPVFIPRNHAVEEALESAARNDMTRFNTLLEVLKQPYTYRSEFDTLLHVPADSDKEFVTYCGT